VSLFQGSIYRMRPSAVAIAKNYVRGEPEPWSLVTSVAVLVVLVVTHQISIRFVALMIATGAICGALALAIYLCGYSAEIMGTDLIVRRLFKRSIAPADDVTSMRLLKIHGDSIWGSDNTFPSFRVAFVGKHNQLVEEMSGWGWTRARLGQLATKLGCEIDPEFSRIDRHQFEARFQGAARDLGKWIAVSVVVTILAASLLLNSVLR
jgi:hypothetical protein